MTDTLINPNSVQKALEDHFDYFDENGEWACGGFTVTPLESIASDLALAYLNQAAEIERLKRRVKEAERLIKRVVTDVNWPTDNKSLWVDLCAFYRETRADK